MSSIRRHLTYANVMVTILAFIVLGGGAAYATHLVVNSSDVADDSLRSVDVRGKPGSSGAPAVNGTLNTHDISGQSPSPANGTPFVDGTLTQWDVRNGSLVGADVADDSLRGTDISDDSLRGRDIEESTLGEVPSATIGGLGRWTGSFPQSDVCDPNSATFIPCATTSLNLPKPSRVLVIGRVQAAAPAMADGFGRCRIGTTAGPLLDSEVPIIVPGKGTDNLVETDNTSVIGITGVFPAGSHGFGVDCNETGGQIMHRAFGVVAVGISPG
jgi:hypothetical protein